MASNDCRTLGPSLIADEPLQVERHLLASRSNLQLPSCEVTAVSNERLLDIEWILIDGCDDVLAESSIVLQLREDLPVGVRPDISVKLQALDQVCIGVMISDSEGCDLRRFNSLAQIESERGVAVRIAARERNVLQIVERLRSQRRIGKHGPVFLPAIEMNLRSIVCLENDRCGAVVGTGSVRRDTRDCRRQEGDPRMSSVP